MSENIRELHGQRFVMATGEHGCVDRIVPVHDSVAATVRTIGATADVNARPATPSTEFFDPKVRGDCVIYDLLTHQMHTFRHPETMSGSFKATQRWRQVDDYWEWSMEVDRLEGDQRELRVELTLPHPIFPDGMGFGHSKWDLWLPVAQESLGNDYGLQKVHFCQWLWDEKTDVPLPLCTLFHTGPGVSLGFSCLLPPDQMWYTDFEIDQRNWQTKITFKNLGLTAGSTLRLRLWCFDHEGDWRSAMGWVRRKFPALLGPVPGQEKLEGNMAYTVPMIPEKRIGDWSRKMHLRWNELFHFRNFGDVFPPEPFNADHFKTPEHPEWTADGLTYDDLNRYIDMCHKHDVKVMPYFNVSDCESTIARKRFPESIARFYDQELVPWIYYDGRNYCIVMNGDPEYPWFDHVMSQYDKLLRRCPGIDGLFFDQMCYGWIDTAHFDGQTFRNNKPAYNMGNMYVRALKKFRELFPRPRINGLGNGVIRWQMMEYIDGVMAEGDPRALSRFSLICPERPSICLAEGEYAFQNALYFGSWLHVSPYYRYPTTEELPEDAVRLFAAYQPLINFLEGRKMVYDPHPLTVGIDSPSAYQRPLLNEAEHPKANIFRTPWGDYAIVILALAKGMTTGAGPVPLNLRIHLPDSDSLKHAVIFGVDYQGYTITTPIPAADGGLELKIPAHGAATMVLLTGDLQRLQVQKQWEHLAGMKM